MAVSRNWRAADVAVATRLREAARLWRRLPQRCRTRLPTLFRDGWDRRHTYSSVNWPKQCLILPRALVNSFAAPRPTAVANSSAVIPVCSLTVISPTRSGRGRPLRCRALLSADHNPTHPDRLAPVVGGRVVNARIAEYCPASRLCTALGALRVIRAGAVSTRARSAGAACQAW